MDFLNYDILADESDENESDENYFAFVKWLSDLIAEELRQVKGDRERQRQALCRFWKRGYKANLTPGELIDFLGANTPSILDKAGYDEAEGDAAMQLSDALTSAEIDKAPL